MHYLHKILVHIPSAINMNKIASKAELLNEIIAYAQRETECFCEIAFDWREVNSSGGWSDEYPQQAYIAADDLDWFINELHGVLAMQRGEIDYYLSGLQEVACGDLAVLSNKLWERGSFDDDVRKNYTTNMAAYYLLSLAKHLYGEYRFDSHFYNTSSLTAHLYKSDIDKIRQNPDEWALVMFDYHY